MSRPLAYWHSGGDMMCVGGVALSAADAAWLHDVHLDEARAAVDAGDRLLGARALTLASQLSAAAQAARRWRRASIRQVTPEPGFGEAPWLRGGGVQAVRQNHRRD